MKRAVSKVLATLMAATLLFGTGLKSNAAERLASGYSSYAYSVGTDYSYFLHPNIDTSEDAEYASTAYGIAGYTSYYSLSPTVSYMRGNAPDGRKRMESGVVFLSGHGNSDCVSFNYKGKNGDYKTGIYNGKNFDSSSSGYKYVGVDSLDLSKTKIMVFAACQTASGTSNIAKRAADNGADATIGWTVSVGASAHTKWLKRFNDELAAGSTIKRAKEYADSFNYSDNEVKKGKIYGASGTTIKGLVPETVPMRGDVISDQRTMRLKKKIVLASDNLEEFAKQTLTAVGVNADINDFVIQNNDSTVDLIYTVNGIETLNGYTIVIDNGYATAVYNNMGVFDSSDYRMGIKRRDFSVLSDSYIDSEMKKTEMEVSSDYTVLNQESKHIFDADSNKEYLYIITDYKDESGAYGRSEKFIEIKGSDH